MGDSGSVEWTEPGFAETNRRDTGNTTFTDYDQNEKAKERMADGFRDRRQSGHTAGNRR